MATLDELSRALIAADKAGDAQAARILAGEITRLRAPKVDEKQFAFDPMRDMSGTDRVLAGMGKAFTDVARGAGQLVGAVDRKDVAESRARDAPLMATTGGTVGNIAGNVALFAPTAMIPGANTITGGALAGAATGLLQPSVSTEESIKNVAFGGIAGGVVPAAVAGVRTARAAAEPFYETGRNAIVGRALNRAAGADAPATANRLREAATPFVGPSQGPIPRTVMGEFVPGSVPTVGQASGNAGVAALERAATAGNPEVTNAVSTLMQGQNAARVGVLDEMAGRTNGARDFHVAMRDETADQLYGQARRAGIDPAALAPEALQNITDFAQRVPPDVMAYARRLAQISGEPMDNGTSVQGLHWVKKAIDGLIGQAQRSGDGAAVRAYTGLQHDLLTGMDNLSPAYGEARRQFAAMSRPINQMDVAQELTRAVNPLSGNLQPAQYARLLNDGTAARATGMANATLGGTMEPAQANALASILLDVQRANAAQTVGRGVGSDTVQKLAYTNILDESGVPSLLRNFAPAQLVGGLGARAADAAYGRANRELSNRLAEVMLDPAQAAQLMLAGAPRQPNALLQLMQRGGSGLALTAPAAANARQQ